MRGLFITGTDTGAGKTIVSAALLAAMVRHGEPVRAHKPVVTGVDESAADWPADHVLLGSISGMRPEDVSPLRYPAAVSPHLAASLAGETIDPARLLGRARSAAEPDHTLIVEGVGGLLVPLASGYTVADFACELGLGLLIAARAGLGTINHTLLTLHAARTYGLHVHAVVLTPWPAAPSELELSNRETIASLGEVEVATLEPLENADPQGLARAGERLPWRRWLAS